MIQKRKIIAIVCSIALTAALFGSCGKNDSAGESAPAVATESSAQPSAMPSLEAKSIVRVGALQGPTGLGLVQLMKQNEKKQTKNIYEFSLDGAPDAISGKLISGELDIAAVPTNVAATLYEKTEHQVKIIAVNTLGVLYLMQKTDSDPIESISELKGKTIYSTGQGATQEYVLNYLLEKNGLTDDVTVEYKSEHAELAALMLDGTVELALLPQPFVTTVTMKDDSVKTALNITDEWAATTGNNKLTMGCLVVRNDFLEKNQAAVDSFLEEYQASTEFVTGNVEEAAALSGKFEVIKEEVAVKAIPECNIVYIAGSDMKTSVAAYLQMLFDAEPKSVGGSMPDDEFYYIP